MFWGIIIGALITAWLLQGSDSKPRAAGSVVVYEDQILMVRSQDGRWGLPGGFVEPGESGHQAAVRETEEESGVRVTPGAPAFAQPDKGFVAYHGTPVAPPAPRPDGVETTAAKMMSKRELRRARLRFPEQRDFYLSLLSGEDDSED